MDSNPEAIPQQSVVFKEVQRFRQWWLWLLIGLTAFPTLLVLLYQLWAGDNSEASNTTLVVLILAVPVPVLLLFLLLRLTIIIDASGIRYGWNIIPGRLNRLGWSDIESGRLIKYGFVGYGYRISRKHGIVYNVSGSRGLQLVRKNGSKILLGTSRPQEMDSVLRVVYPPYRSENSV